MEYWLRGPVEGIPALLQPVAHALLQAREEINALVAGFPQEKLWEKPAGMASVGFHLQHLTGVLDRLLTYAREEGLSEEQFAFLKAEGVAAEISIETLLQQFNRQVDLALDQLASTDPGSLTAAREVGRNRLPSTVIGLLTHAAEHTMRHTGQLLVTAKIQQNHN